MTPRVAWALVACAIFSTPLVAQRRAAKPRTRTVTDAACSADLGKGIKSGIDFCDVVIGSKPDDGISMKIPRHRGVTHLRFDLFNRFAVPPGEVRPVLAFSRQTARVAVIDPKGKVLARAIVVGEFRRPADLYDRLSGGAGPGGVKLVAPGPATSVEVTLPSSVSTVGVVGEQVEMVSRLGTETFDTPGRPIAMAGRFSLEYTPR